MKSFNYSHKNNKKTGFYKGIYAAFFGPRRSYLAPYAFIRYGFWRTGIGGASGFLYIPPKDGSPLFENAKIGYKSAVVPRLLDNDWLINIRNIDDKSNVIESEWAKPTWQIDVRTK